MRTLWNSPFVWALTISALTALMAVYVPPFLPAISIRLPSVNPSMFGWTILGIGCCLVGVFARDGILMKRRRRRF